MPFESYLIEEFDNTHENQFFRELSGNLQRKFENEKGLHVLLANLSVDGAEIDAIFIKRGQISVIDFKDYAGMLYFAENGPWEIKTKEGNRVKVKGGGQYKNPFQQIKNYRLSVFKYFDKKQKEILEGNRDALSWAHTGSIVLFQGKIIIYNPEDIPNRIKKWFHISDNEKIINLLSDITSPALNLTDKEINNILGILNVKTISPPIPPPKPVEIKYYPSDKHSFKQALLKTKKAYIKLHKTDKTWEIKEWDASNFKESSSVSHNLRSGYLRNAKKKGILKAEVSTKKDDLQ